MQRIVVLTSLCVLTLLATTLIVACGGSGGGSSDFDKSCLVSTRISSSGCGGGPRTEQRCFDLDPNGGGLIDGLSFDEWCADKNGSSTACSGSCCVAGTGSGAHVVSGRCD